MASNTWPQPRAMDDANAKSLEMLRAQRSATGAGGSKGSGCGGAANTEAAVYEN